MIYSQDGSRHRPGPTSPSTTPTHLHTLVLTARAYSDVLEGRLRRIRPIAKGEIR